LASHLASEVDAGEPGMYSVFSVTLRIVSMTEQSRFIYTVWDNGKFDRGRPGKP
jgi:hypothetical protein